MFAFYTAGMRASDIITLKWSNIQNGRLIYQMHKTGKIHSLKLTDKAKKILSYYGPKKFSEYVFPFFNSDIDYADAMFLPNRISAKTALINKYLKVIATKAEINKKISTHTARHSFADIARKKTNNIYNLSKTLGHSDLKVTEVYLASFDEEAVDSTLDEVFK
jgi:integrase